MIRRPGSNLNYILFCLAACGYFVTAAVQSWPNPIPFTVLVDEDGNPYLTGSSGHSYSSGTYRGRSSGGFGGGGK